MKLFLQKIGALLTGWLVIASAITPLHEAGHVWAIRLMGGDAYISFTPGIVWTGGFANFITVPDHGLPFVYFSGGLFVFLGCMLIWFWAWKSKTMWDMYVELPCLSIALMQLFYAFVEMLIYPKNQELFHQVYWIAMLVGFLAAIAIEHRRAWKWLSTKETITRKEVYI